MVDYFKVLFTTYAASLVGVIILSGILGILMGIGFLKVITITLIMFFGMKIYMYVYQNIYLKKLEKKYFKNENF